MYLKNLAPIDMLLKPQAIHTLTGICKKRKKRMVFTDFDHFARLLLVSVIMNIILKKEGMYLQNLTKLKETLSYLDLQNRKSFYVK